MDNKKITAGIIGGAGYTGGEMIRILLNHPNVEIKFIHSRSNAGQKINAVHTDLIGDTNLEFTNTISEADVLFLCLGHGESKIFLNENNIAESTVIIDLSQDFRLADTNKINERNFVYGLPEINKQAIQQTKSIANPGCFATCIQLALLPLAKNNLLNDTNVTGITGATGAGQKLQQSSHFAWRVNNIQAYKTLSHQHMYEVKETLASLQTGFENLFFVPLRGDFARGIYITAYTDCNLSLEEVKDLYKNFYADAAFTHISDNQIDLKQVVNTNKCIISLEKQDNKIIVHAAIDNLLKGASGQAVQNMNIIFGFDEKTGLQLKPISF